MRLAVLLASLSDEELERLAVEHVRTDEKLARPQLYNFLEGTLRSYRFVNDFITTRQPPTFALLTTLLDSPGYEITTAGFRDQVMAETSRIAALIDSGELLSRDDGLRLYRQAFYEARRNDLDLNASEATLLAVLRRELGIAQVEHFLLEHHQDFRGFWERDDSFTHEENALRSAGLVFVRDDRVILPEEVAPAVRQTLGVDMPTDSARRLLTYLSSGELATILEQKGSRVSGSKETRLERILTERIQPREVLRSVALPTLKDICRAAAASVSGSKDELIERIINHFAQGKDQLEDEALVDTPILEDRQLTQERFETLFSALQHQELTDILRRFPHLRQAGTKETKIRTLWQSHLAERTLLGELINRDLEEILQRLGLRLRGSKNERLDRIITHFAVTQLTDPLLETPEHGLRTNEPPPIPQPHVVAAQELFRQKASQPQASLQPWLEEVLDGSGRIRCYATEDAVPTKQLKNKLAQAAAARDGLLVLLLSDEHSFAKAREALIERWMTNPEWSKSVSCVALAFPLGSPVVHAIIENKASSWPDKLRHRLFPEAEVTRAKGKENEQGDAQAVSPTCARCAGVLPIAAKFCPSCGIGLL
jgi:hypothetical protein